MTERQKMISGQLYKSGVRNLLMTECYVKNSAMTLMH